QSFSRRFLLWADVLDPLLLLKSSDEIKRARLLIQTKEKTLSEPLRNNQVFWSAVKVLTQSSVHPDTNNVIPILFRPPGNCLFFFYFYGSPGLNAGFIVPCSLLFLQFVFHSYTTAFTLLNGNGTPKAEEYSLQQKQMFYGLGAISYAACVGALPLIFMNRYTLKSPLTQLIVKKLLPAPLLGLTSAFTAAVVRSPEFEHGIEVMDRNGKVVGVSRNAGEKAVRETALSRAVLFGTSFLLPEALVHLVQRAKLVKNPRALAAVRLFLITSVLAGMVPVSLSMFSQCGEIKRADLEPEILSLTEETELFYNRGV
ncbi:SFXN4 protein, partial [Tyrannus savana]|nr:SFXN4 protein [Tyrannus savana]